LKTSAAAAAPAASEAVDKTRLVSMFLQAKQKDASLDSLRTICLLIFLLSRSFDLLLTLEQVHQKN
jgi:hypothetical protein